MRVPTRKPGVYANLKPDPYITVEKYQALSNKLTRLKAGQPLLIQEVKRLASDGDFSENAAYQIAKGKLRGLNQRMLEIEDHLKRAIIIKNKAGQEKVQLGNRVTVEVKGKTKIYLILGSSETNPNAGVISRNSPIGSALIGHSAGECVKVQLADREIEYKIIKIE